MTPKDPIAALSKLADIHREAVAAGQVHDVPDPDRWRPAKEVTEPGWYWMRTPFYRDPVATQVEILDSTQGEALAYRAGSDWHWVSDEFLFAGPLIPPEDTR